MFCDYKVYLCASTKFIVSDFKSFGDAKFITMVVQSS
jgi:hypothetical protein